MLKSGKSVAKNQQAQKSQNQSNSNSQQQHYQQQQQHHQSSKHISQTNSESNFSVKLPHYEINHEEDVEIVENPPILNPKELLQELESQLALKREVQLNSFYFYILILRIRIIYFFFQ